MPISGLQTGENITAAQYNELVQLYNAYWQGASYTWDDDHPSEDIRQQGWGQKWYDRVNDTLTTVMPQVSTLTQITAQHINDLITHVNAGVWHIDEAITPKVLRGTSTSVSVSNYTQLIDIYDNTLASKKLDIDPSSLQVDSNLISTTNSGTAWTSTYLVSVQTYSFTSYDAARHFFNSGGELVMDFSTSTGGTNGASIGWNVFFDNLGLVRIDANSTSNDGDGDGDPMFSAIGNKGFYDINAAASGSPEVYTETYSISSDTGGSLTGIHPATGAVIDMGTYGGGIYSTRRFKIAMKGDDSGSDFKIFVKITLQEDPDDSVSGPIDLFVNATFGAANPLTTPIESESTGNQYFQPDSPAPNPFNVFVERPAPTVSNTTVWTATETPESI